MSAMRRREFLIGSTRAAITVSLIPFAACQRRQAPPTQGGKDTEWDAAIGDIEKVVPAMMTEMMVPGVSIAVIKNATVAWRRGFGVRDSASKVPVDDDTTFGAGSMSKPVFAYAVMKLCEKGVLGLDTTLTTFAPIRPLDDPRLDAITPRHILAHTSGFQNWRSRREPLRIHFMPGERHMYSGEGYWYLQSVVTHLTGRVDQTACATFEDGLNVCATDIDAFMRTNVLTPFGMSSSGYVWDEAHHRHAALPHSRDGKPMVRPKGTAIDAARYAAAGALLTTPTDYAKFVIEVINPKPSDAFRLDEKSVDEMLRPQVKVPDDKYGSSWALGWQVQQSGLINHGGDNPGFHAQAVASVARRSGLVVMTNGDNGHEFILKLLFGDIVPRLV
jgi:CubicO group peptidase (beta-lactamase class C family)